MKNYLSKLTAWVLTLAFIFSAIPMPVHASSAADLVTRVRALGLQAELSAADPGVVNVFGAVNNVGSTLSLNINAGVTVNWGADFVGGMDGKYLIALTGAGSFNIVNNARLGNTGTGGAINVTGAGISVNVLDGELFSDVNGISLNIAASNTAVNITADGKITNSGANSAINVSANISNTVINVNGGLVESVPSGHAINDGGTALCENSTQINVVNNGRVIAGSACGIKSTGRNSAVYVMNSLVENDASTNSNPTIYVNAEPSDNRVNIVIGGSSTVRTINESSSSFVMQTTGSMRITDDAHVTAINGRAINLVGQNSVAYIEGGVVSSERGIAISTATTQPATVPNAGIVVSGGWVRVGDGGTAIQTTGTNGHVTVTGGMVTATTGLAIRSTQSANVSGGFVFSYGTTVANTVSAPNTDIGGTGVVVSWNSATTIPVYAAGDNNDLAFAPSGSDVVWAKGSPSDGINYTNGTNTGFFPLAQVTVELIQTEPHLLIYHIGNERFYLNSVAPGNEYSGQVDRWSASGTTLTLNDFEWASNRPVALLITGGSDLTLNLQGKNMFFSSGTGNAAGINSEANITITGGGELSATATAGTGIIAVDFTVSNGTVYAVSGNANDTHGFIADTLTIGEFGNLNASASGTATSGAIYAVNVNRLRITEGEGSVTASGSARAVSNAVLELPGGYSYRRGTRADGSNANAFGFPADSAYTYSGSYRFVNITAGRAHDLVITNGIIQNSGTSSGRFFAGERVNIAASGLYRTGVVYPTTQPTYMYETIRNVFGSWLSNNGGSFFDEAAENTVFVMPDNPVDISVQTQQAYKLWVDGGYIYDEVGGTNTNRRLGYYTANTVVMLRGFSSYASYSYFNGWTRAYSGSSANPITIPGWENMFSNVHSSFTRFTMPGMNVNIEAAPHTILPTGTLHMLTVTGGNITSPPGALITPEYSQGSYTAGYQVRFEANIPDGQHFSHWEMETPSIPGTYMGRFENTSSASIYFIMAETDVEIRAVFADINYTLHVENGTVAGGDSVGSFTAGTPVNIIADPPRPGMRFSHWEFDGIVSSSEAYTVIMPNHDLTITAHYEAEDYLLTVVGGMARRYPGDAATRFAFGETVQIIATPSEGQIFVRWNVTTANGNLNDPESPTTEFCMPAGNAVIVAEYENIVAPTPEPTPTPTPGPTGPTNPSVTPTPAPTPEPTTEPTTEPTPEPTPTNDPDDPPHVLPTPPVVDDIAIIDMPRHEAERIAGEATGAVVVDLSGHSDVRGKTICINLLEIFWEEDLDFIVIFEHVEITLSPTDGLWDDLDLPCTELTIVIEHIDKRTLSCAQMVRVGQVRGCHSLVYISAFLCGELIDIPLTIRLPYPPHDTNTVSAWQLEADARLTDIDGYFDAETETMTFFTEHHGYYVVGYNPVIHWTNIFSDVVEGEWYYDAVAYLNYTDVFHGYGGGIYAPHDAMTRAMFVTALYNLEGDPPIRGGASFNDVRQGAWYYDAVIWAAENGIVSGVGDGNFAPTQPITRQEMAVMLVSYANFAGDTIITTRNMPHFNDYEQIAPWAEESVRILAQACIMSGSNNLFMPIDISTRAQVTQLVKNFLLHVRCCAG